MDKDSKNCKNRGVDTCLLNAMKNYGKSSSLIRLQVTLQTIVFLRKEIVVYVICRSTTMLIYT